MRCLVVSASASPYVCEDTLGSLSNRNALRETAACCRFITPNFSSAAGRDLALVMTTTLSSLPLPPSIQLKLAAAGFTSVGDFDGLSAAELAEDLAVEPREAQKLLAQVRSRADTCVC